MKKIIVVILFISMLFVAAPAKATSFSETQLREQLVKTLEAVIQLLLQQIVLLQQQIAEIQIKQAQQIQGTPVESLTIVPPIQPTEQTQVQAQEIIQQNYPVPVLELTPLQKLREREGVLTNRRRELFEFFTSVTSYQIEQCRKESSLRPLSEEQNVFNDCSSPTNTKYKTKDQLTAYAELKEVERELQEVSDLIKDEESRNK